MNSLIWFVLLYWLVSVGIGLYAARFVKSSADYAVAGRSLPMAVVTATVFATWFGSEIILGVPAVFMKEGLRGVIADPFGGAFCLILVGLFFARPLYRMNLLTIGDYYRNKYGKVVEIGTSLAVVISYLGWVAAQLKALGLVFHVVSNQAMSVTTGVLIGAGSVLAYTLMGGMLSVAVTDFIQMIIIVLGLIYVAFQVSGMVGDPVTVIQAAHQSGHLNLLPAADLRDILWFVAALITMMLGSIPQQDVFQRISSSKNETVAMRSSVLGGVLYLSFAFIPMFLVYSTQFIDKQLVERLIDTDPQLILPSLVMNHTPVFAQIIFFGALLSAVKSCASATLLAPSVTFTENIVREFVNVGDDKHFLRLMRIVLFCFTCAVTILALYTNDGIFKMVENAYKITLVSAFVPLAFGLYWKSATREGAVAAMFGGFTSWILMEWQLPDGFWPPQLVGFLVSLGLMVCVSLLAHIKKSSADRQLAQTP